MKYAAWVSRHNQVVGASNLLHIHVVVVARQYPVSHRLKQSISLEVEATR